MKEIDFLPECFHDDRKRRLGVQRQCFFLCILFLIMILSNALDFRSIAEARAELVLGEKQCIEAGRVIFEAGRIKKSIANRQEIIGLIANLGTNPDVANAMSELSRLIPDNVVVSNLEIVDNCSLDKAGGLYVIRLHGKSTDVRAVTVLMGAMEESSGFCAVNLVYSKNIATDENIKGDLTENTYDIEFEISSELVFQVKSGYRK